MKYKRSQSGDTIIEVLLAMVVVGLSLGTAYGIANGALATGRNAQERSEAVKIAESQIELLKNNIDPAGLNINYTTPLTPFCIQVGITRGDVTNPAECSSGFYNLSMEYVPAAAGNPEVYRSIVTCDVPTSQEDARVEISYRP